MQTVTIIVSLILTIIGFVCIHLKTLNRGKNTRKKTSLVVMSGTVLGALVATVVLHPVTAVNLMACVLLGILTSEVIYILYLIAKSIWEKEKIIAYYDDGSAPKYYITGDKHRNFAYVKRFCHDMNTRKKDVLIILGDAGFNYFQDARDDELKKEAAAMNITLFCLHGNKECRAKNIATYGIRNFCGGKVYYEPKYPNIFFAIDGEIYTFEGKKYMVVGGAHSVDKLRCLDEGTPFWEDEMPDAAVKREVEEQLAKENNSIYGLMTHTCPINYLPTEMFLSTRQNAAANKKPHKLKLKIGVRKRTRKPPLQLDIDRSTEEWLGTLEQKVSYEVWYCGHYHIDKQIDKVNMMYNEIRPLHL